LGDQFEKVLRRHILHCGHSEGLAGASLAEHEGNRLASLHRQLHQRLDGLLKHGIVGGSFIVHTVKGEGDVVDESASAVRVHASVVHGQVVASVAGDHVRLLVANFVVKERALPHANLDVRILDEVLAHFSLGL
jgi:hypothetical protein